MKQLLSAVFIIGLGAIAIYGYREYSDDIQNALFQEGDTYRIFVDTVALEVSVADDSEERRQGLSGTDSLGELEGKLFIFETADTHGFWMKDMLYPIDILWIDEDLTIVHIAESATPDSYPTVFKPSVPARFVLETNASFVGTYKITVGTKVTLPPGLIPDTP